MIIRLLQLIRRTRHPILRAASLLSVVVLIGIVGFKIIGGPEVSILDAAYMTVVTLTTVGYGEIVPISGNPPAQAFAIVLMMAGIGSFIFFFSNFTAFIVEGHLARLREVRRMKKTISEMTDHDIVCGLGETGTHVVRELVQTRRSVVVIDADPDIAAKLVALFPEANIPSVVGDATDDDHLEAAGVERARGIVACAQSDKDNL
ncbi:MAG: NAD-binding protein, partial [Myxococcota bacterium]